MHATPLEARVAAVNAANAYARELQPKLAAVFRPLVGQKIRKADGPLMAKVAKLVPELPNSVSLSVYRNTSDYSLAWTVKTCETYSGPRDGDQFAVYYETVLYVGDMRDGVLTTVSDKPPMLRTDYTAAEIKAKRAVYKAAKQAADDAESALSPFGEYDR